MDKDRFPSNIDVTNFNMDDQKLIRVGPKGYVFPSTYRELGPKYYNFHIRSDDVFLVGYPRSGTTRCQEAIWLLNNNLDYDKAKLITVDNRCRHLELDMSNDMFCINTELAGSKKEVFENLESPLEWLPTAPSPRYIKSHLPLSLLPPHLLDTTKVVYMARDPRDVVVSLYHLLKLKFLKNIEFDQFWHLFHEGYICFTPIFEHIKEAWDQRSHPNLLFLTYEEMSKDLPSTLLRMAEFFGKKYTDEQIGDLCEHLSFENFKKNKAVNGEFTFLKPIGAINDSEHSFIRKGKVRGWEDYFNEDLKEEAEHWMAQNLAGSDMPFTI